MYALFAPLYPVSSIPPRNNILYPLLTRHVCGQTSFYERETYWQLREKLDYADFQRRLLLEVETGHVTGVIHGTHAFLPAILRLSS
jgi:hypothetical protein